MKEVPVPVVKKVWGKMKKLSQPTGVKLMEQMSREQPALLTYLHSVDEDSLSAEERGILVFLGLVIWQAMKQAGGTLPQVSEEAMIQAESATLKSLESLTPRREDGSGGINDLIEACGQGELMDLALDALLEAAGCDDDQSGAGGEEAAGPLVRPENVSLLLLNLKTVVDVLNA
jgi:hypothetical protein